jgi:hypothetical protein
MNSRVWKVKRNQTLRGGAYQREIASPRGERYYFLEDKKRALVIIVVREREREREEMWKS